MQFEIENHYHEDIDPMWLAKLETVLVHYAEQEGLPDELSIGLTFVDDEEMQAINREQRGIDRTTDVLSFPLYEPDEPIELFEEELAPFGDIVLSVPKALAQAEEYGHSVEREVLYLIVHGLLHLAGYDHLDEAEKAEMRAAEERLLSAIKVGR